MAWPDKRLTSTSAIRNKFGPRADRLLIAYPMVETTGTELANLGLSNTYRSDLPAFGDGAIVNGDANTFVGVGDNAPCIEFGNGASNCYARVYTAVSQVDFDRGTMLLRFKQLDAPGLLRVLFHSGAANAVDGRFRLLRLNDDRLQVSLRVPGVNEKLSFSGVDWSVWHTLVVTWGERGLTAFLDTATNIDQNISITQGWRILAAEVATLSATRNAVTVYNSRMSAFAIWDTQLHAKEIADLLDDPYLPWRPSPDPITAFATIAGPIAGRPTDTTLTLRCVTGPGNPNLVSAAVQWRVAYGTDRANLDMTSAVASVSADTDVYKSLDVVLTDLVAQAEYFYRPEWSTDGTNWYPFPGGTGRYGGGSFCIVADDHVCSRSDGGKPDSLIEGFGVELFETGVSRKFYANWRTDRDLRLRSAVSFIVHLGDAPYVATDKSAGKADLDASKFDRAAAWVNFHHLLVKTAPIFQVFGNHEGMPGYRQNAHAGTDTAIQKQSTIANKRFFPNPTNSTYPEGGEDEGDPSLDNTLEWLPGDVAPFSDYPGGYAGYLNDYVIDGAGENASPLGNYYARTWQDTLIVVLDVLRYTKPGDPEQAIGTGGEAKRPGPEWILGAKQTLWLRKVLAESSAKWKIIFQHHLPGGEAIGISSGNDYYGRGSGIKLGSPAELELHQLCRAYGVTAVFKGHDHKFCHAIRDGVNYITCPTAGAPSLTKDGGGWHWTEIDQSYGTAESEGADLRSGGPGSGTAAGIVKMLNVIGYLEVAVTAATFTIKLRQTALTRDDSVGPLTETLLHNERYVGPVYSPSSEQITLSETPEDVGYAALDSDLSGSWWSSAPADKKGAAVGHYGYDEDYADGQVTLSSTGDADTRVAVVPRTLYSAELVNASLPLDTVVSKVEISFIQTDQSTITQRVQVPETIIVVAKNVVTGHSKTQYRIYENHLNTPFITLSSTTNVAKNGNVRELTKNRLGIILTPNTKYKVSIRAYGSQGWSLWSGLKSLRTRDLDYKYNKGSEPTITVSSRGAIVDNR